ncbi:O-antigen ligase family protein [Carnobacterium sp.]|uniref:O-antigen ligase family protein n=1 Tax=Carnobacterium sp. TaxID=48221 RepID=UPI00388EDBD5
MKKLTYILAGSVFLGAQILAIDLGVAKLSLYRIMLVIISCLMVVLIFKNDSRLSFYSNALGKNYTRFYFFWLIYSLISVIWVQDIGGWINAIFFLGCGCLSILYMGIFIREEKDIKNLFKTIFALILLHNIIGIMEILTGNYLFANLNKLDKYHTFATQPSTRIPISIYANQNDFATMLLAGITISFILFKNSNKTSIKFVYLLTIVSSVFLLYRTGSRGNLIALLIGISTLLITKYLQLFTKKNIVKFLMILLSICLGIIIFSPEVQQKIISLNYSLRTTFFVEGNSNMTRVNLIRNGFYFLVQSFGLGTGAGNIEHWLEFNSIFSTGTIYNIHNWWMEILSGYGIVIFVLYVAVYFLMIRQLFINYKYSKNKFVRTTSWILLAYLFSFILSSISSSSNMLIEWQWVFWGVIITFIRYSEKLPKMTEYKEGCKDIERVD